MHFVDLVLCQLIVPFYNLTLIINVAMKKKTKKKRWSSIKFKSVYLTKSINLLQFPTNALKHEIKMFCVARKTLFVVEKICQAKFAQTLTGQKQYCIHLMYLIYVLILKGCHRTTIKVFNRLQKHLDGEKPGWRN